MPFNLTPTRSNLTSTPLALLPKKQPFRKKTQIPPMCSDRLDICFGGQTKQHNPKDGLEACLADYGKEPLLSAEEEVILGQSVVAGNLAKLVRQSLSGELKQELSRLEGDQLETRQKRIAEIMTLAENVRNNESTLPFKKLFQLYSPTPNDGLNTDFIKTYTNEKGELAYTINKAVLKPTIANPKNTTATTKREKLLEKLEARGDSSKKRIIEANLRLAISQAKKQQNRGLEFLDLIQEGTLGLEKAVGKYDPSQGFRFSTYAFWKIRQTITRAILDQGRTIRLPRPVGRLHCKMDKVRSKLQQNLGRPPTLNEWALGLDISVEDLRLLLQRTQKTSSLNTWVGDEQNTELGDTLPDKTQDVMTSLVTANRYQIVREAFSEADLTVEERMVIKMRYGFPPYNKILTRKKAGELLEKSDAVIRNIENGALKKLRNGNVGQKIMQLR